MSIYLDGEIAKAYIGRFELSDIWLGEQIIYSKGIYPEPYLPNEYFYFKAYDSTAQVSISEETLINYGTSTTAPTIDMSQFANYVTPTFEYSYDKNNWSPYTLGTAITLQKGVHSKVYFRGSNIKPWFDSYNTTYSETHEGSSSASNYIHYHYIWIQANTIEGKVKTGGNLLSLRDKTLSDITTIPCDYAFSRFFNSCTNLLTAPVLSATTLKPYCYGGVKITIDSLFGNHFGMFEHCSSLIAMPDLPATTLANYCYASMFDYCTSLTDTIQLPATTLATYCYANMFCGCANLITVSTLPVTTLATGCYAGMFSYCTSLTMAPDLPATTLASKCYGDYVWLGPSYNGMFQGCTALTTAPNLPATTLATYCYAYMFSGCKALTRTPSLPITTLANYCYAGMFQGCTGLTAITQLPATTLVEGCYYYMFSGVKISTSSSSPCVYAYRIPSSGTGTTSTDYYKDLEYMFTNLDGSGSYTPSINTTYYINASTF